MIARNKYEKTWVSRNFIIICAMGFLSSFGTSVAETLVTKYAEQLGAMPSMIGLVSSVCSITALITLPLSGPLLDAFKKTWIYFWFTLCMVIAYAGFAFSRSVQALIVFRLINGIGKGVNSAVLMAMASDVLPEEHKSAGIIYYSLIAALSVAFAPSAGLMFLQAFSYQVAFIFGSFLEILTLVLDFFISYQFNASGKIRVSLKNMVERKSLPAAVLMFFLSTAYSTVNSFIVVFATGMGINNIGLYFTVYSLVLLLSRPVVGKLTGRFTNTQIMLPAMAFFALSMYMTGISRSTTMFLITAVVAAFGYGVCQPLVQAMAIEKAGAGRSGVGSSTCFIGTNLGYFAGPALGGKIAEVTGYGVMYKVMIIPLLFGLVIILNEIKKSKKEREAI